MMSTSEIKLQACKQTRGIAAFSLARSISAFKQLPALQQSEAKLRDMWLENMQQSHSIFPDGWYMPPPHGIGVLFGSSRVTYVSLRTQSNWPKENILLDKDNDIAYAYASPVDRSTGMIGDIGMTLYFGNDPKIQAHLKSCLELDKEIFKHIQVGMKLSEIFHFAQKHFQAHRFAEPLAISTTDPASVNIGHTVPASYEDWKKEEKKLLQQTNNSWVQVKEMISKKRRFVNGVEDLVIKPGMAITIEPRPTLADHSDIPMASYHTIVIIHENGKKELLTNFDEIFQAIGMNYMIS